MFVNISFALSRWSYLYLIFKLPSKIQMLIQSLLESWLKQIIQHFCLSFMSFTSWLFNLIFFCKQRASMYQRISNTVFNFWFYHFKSWVLWLPSQNGLLLVCLQLQNQYSFVSSGTNLTGLSLIFKKGLLCVPSQNGYKT